MIDLPREGTGTGDLTGNALPFLPGLALVGQSLRIEQSGAVLAVDFEVAARRDAGGPADVCRTACTALGGDRQLRRVLNSEILDMCDPRRDGADWTEHELNQIERMRTVVHDDPAARQFL